MRQKFLTSLLFATFLTLMFTLPAMSGELDRFAGLSGKIDIAGGTAHIPVMEDAAKNIMSKYPRINITVAGGGSGVGVQKVGEGLVDIGNTGQPMANRPQSSKIYEQT